MMQQGSSGQDGTSSTVTGEAQGHSPEFQVAQLPPEDVHKLERLEEELAQDTGEDIVVIAYEKHRGAS